MHCNVSCSFETVGNCNPDQMELLVSQTALCPVSCVKPPLACSNSRYRKMAPGGLWPFKVNSALATAMEGQEVGSQAQGWLAFGFCFHSWACISLTDCPFQLLRTCLFSFSRLTPASFLSIFRVTLHFFPAPPRLSLFSSYSGPFPDPPSRQCCLSTVRTTQVRDQQVGTMYNFFGAGVGGGAMVSL